MMAPDLLLVDLNYRIDLPGADIRAVLRTNPVDEASITLQKFDQVHFIVLSGDSRSDYQPLSRS